MFAKNVYSFRNFPVEEKERKWTDCCCTIIAAIFSLTMFIIACASWNRSTHPHIQITIFRLTIPPKHQENYATMTYLTTHTSSSSIPTTRQTNGTASVNVPPPVNNSNAPTLPPAQV